MGLASIIPGIVLGLAALVILCWLIWILFRNLFNLNLRLRAEERILAKKRALVDQAKTLLQAGRYRDCYPLLHQSFILEQIKSSPFMVDRVLEHHLAVLNAVLAFSEKFPVSLANLPVIEELLQMRAALCKAHLNAPRAAKKRLFGLFATNGRPLPQWAAEAFTEKEGNLLEKIEINRRSLEREIDVLFQRITHSAELSEVTYH